MASSALMPAFDQRHPAFLNRLPTMRLQAFSTTPDPTGPRRVWNVFTARLCRSIHWPQLGQGRGGSAASRASSRSAQVFASKPSASSRIDVLIASKS